MYPTYRTRKHHTARMIITIAAEVLRSIFNIRWYFQHLRKKVSKYATYISAISKNKDSRDRWLVLDHFSFRWQTGKRNGPEPAVYPYSWCIKGLTMSKQCKCQKRSFRPRVWKLHENHSVALCLLPSREEACNSSRTSPSALRIGLTGASVQHLCHCRDPTNLRLDQHKAIQGEWQSIANGRLAQLPIVPTLQGDGKRLGESEPRIVL